MMKRPTDEEIRAAERRVEQAERDFGTGTVRTRAAMLDFIVHPVTLLGIAVAAGGAGYLLFKPKPKAPVKFQWPWQQKVSPEAKQTAGASLLSLVLALGMRYAVRNMPRIGYRVLGQALRKRGAFSSRVSTAPTSVTLH
jgi:hypothetical protein